MGVLALITPTGGRPGQFELCAEYMKRQTYTGEVVWLIIDDCFHRSIDIVNYDFKENWNIIKIFPDLLWKEGKNTQSRNISEGITSLLRNYLESEIDGIFIIEDDDYYRPEYIERMSYQIKDYWAIGEMDTIYYNVAYKNYAHNNNTEHASLFQTVFTMPALKLFKSCFGQRFIDFNFWALVPEEKQNLFKSYNAIGIKGMPGRKGIGAGHFKHDGFIKDLDYSHLKEMIGEDYKNYIKFAL